MTTKDLLIAVYAKSILTHNTNKAAIFDLHGDKCDGSLESPHIEDNPLHEYNGKTLEFLTGLPDTAYFMFVEGDWRVDEGVHGLAVFDPHSDDIIHYTMRWDETLEDLVHVARPRLHDGMQWRWFETSRDAMLWKLSCPHLPDRRH